MIYWFRFSQTWIQNRDLKFPGWKFVPPSHFEVMSTVLSLLLQWRLGCATTRDEEEPVCWSWSPSLRSRGAVDSRGPQPKTTLAASGHSPSINVVLPSQYPIPNPIWPYLPVSLPSSHGWPVQARRGHPRPGLKCWKAGPDRPGVAGTWRPNQRPWQHRCSSL